MSITFLVIGALDFRDAEYTKSCSDKDMQNLIAVYYIWGTSLTVSVIALGLSIWRRFQRGHGHICAKRVASIVCAVCYSVLSLTMLILLSNMWNCWKHTDRFMHGGVMSLQSGISAIFIDLCCCFSPPPTLPTENEAQDRMIV